MMAINYQRFIVRDPAVCGGNPIIRGTRVTVRTVLASLAEGLSVEEIVAEFPTLNEAACARSSRSLQSRPKRIFRSRLRLQLREDQGRRELSEPSRCARRAGSGMGRNDPPRVRAAKRAVNVMAARRGELRRSGT